MLARLLARASSRAAASPRGRFLALAGGAAGACAAAVPPRSPLVAWCEASAESESYTPLVPPKLDDPEYNAEVMDSWRAKIQDAREHFAKLDFAGAETALKLALEQAGHFGQGSGPVATSLLNLAQLYRRAGRLGEAEPLLERAADVLDQTAGPHNKVTLLALVDLAATRLDLGDPSGALRSFNDVLARLDIAEQTQKHARQPLAAIRAGCLFSMAKADGALGEWSAAEGRLRVVLALLEARHGDDSSKLLAPCAELARACAQQDKHEEGADFLRRAAGLRELRPKQREELGKLQRELAL